ncbi:MAG: polysaccharide biosynthesis tyrosine autokinase [Phycisphaerales bacterium]
MNNLEKYLDQVIEQRPTVLEPPTEVQEPPTTNVLESVRKRWPIILATVIVICAVGLPAVWFLVEPLYVVQGAVKIKQTVSSMLTGEALTGEVSNYAWFVNTEAHNMMNNSDALGKVLDDLVPRKLAFFSGEPANRIESLLARILPRSRNVMPQEILREAIANKTISAAQLPNTEFLAVTMRSANKEEARTIVDSFVRNYIAQFKLASSSAENDLVERLRVQRTELQRKIDVEVQMQKDKGIESPTAVFDPNERLTQQLVMNRLSVLQNELVRLEVQRVRLEGDILEPDPNDRLDVMSEQFLGARTAYVNEDPSFKELTTNVVQMERDLIVAEQTQTAAYPALQQRKEVLKALKTRLDERKADLEKEFETRWQNRLDEITAMRTTRAPELRKAIKDRIVQVQLMLDEENKNLKREAQNKLEMRTSEDNLRQNRQMLDILGARIAQLELEQDRRPRVEQQVLASVVSEEDKRLKLVGVTVFGALACGVGLALLRDKMDKTLQTPADITRQTDLPILGTTTSSRTIKPALFAEQIAGDYQTIRTNLGLLYNGGMPKRLVISSAGMREGKTTFAVNLATSLAKSGKKVLLIDGDLRKPDIGHMLNVLNNEGGLQNVLLGEDPSGIVCVLPTSGLHVLAANPRYLGDAYELLTSSTAAGQMERLAREYDHLIVDSPPTLAFPDALVWAKLTDAVILVSFAGQTTAPELKEAKERFARIRARILGAVLSNVPVDQGLYRYSYTYRSRGPQPNRKGGKPKKMLLSSSGQTDGEHPPEA